MQQYQYRPRKRKGKKGPRFKKPSDPEQAQNQITRYFTPQPTLQRTPKTRTTKHTTVNTKKILTLQTKLTYFKTAPREGRQGDRFNIKKKTQTLF